MIALKVEAHGDGGLIVFDDAALAFLGAALDDTLIFDGDSMTVQYASGEMGRTFVWTVSKPKP